MERVSKPILMTRDQLDQRIAERAFEARQYPADSKERQTILKEIALLRDYADTKRGAADHGREFRMTDKPMLDGRELSEFELAQIKRQIETLATIDVVSDEMRTLIAQQWPHLLAKIKSRTGPMPPKGPPPKGH